MAFINKHVYSLHFEHCQTPFVALIFLRNYFRMRINYSKQKFSLLRKSCVVCGFYVPMKIFYITLMYFLIGSLDDATARFIPNA